ncbi:MAG TPA: glycoside hydrolase family 43 protein [Bacteroidales bacterium]|nr:glycoside hydrolase family 43 protein [Bacteroidales bacterium]
MKNNKLHPGILSILAVALTLASPAKGQSAGEKLSWTNPVSDSIFMGDPFMLLHNGRYYLYGTTSSGTGFKCWSSADMNHWKSEGFVYHETADSWGKGNYWAPEVYYHDGLFYMAYSCNGKDTTNNRMLLCLAKSSSPTGPFKDVKAPWFDPGYSCIDAHIFFDDDGKIYLYYDKVGYEGTWPDGHLFGYIFCRKLDKDLDPISDPVFCSKAEQPWEHPFSDRSRCNEGCSVIKHNGIYYMTYSANHYQDPYYGIGYSTATSPFGPWTKYAGNPLIGMDEEAGIYGPGHNSFVTSPDSSEMYIVYHTHLSKTNTRRWVNVNRVYFDSAGRLNVLKN